MPELSQGRSTCACARSIANPNFPRICASRDASSRHQGGKLGLGKVGIVVEVRCEEDINVSRRPVCLEFTFLFITIIQDSQQHQQLSLSFSNFQLSFPTHSHSFQLALVNPFRSTSTFFVSITHPTQTTAIMKSVFSLLALSSLFVSSLSMPVASTDKAVVARDITAKRAITAVSDVVTVLDCLLATVNGHVTTISTYSATTSNRRRDYLGDRKS
jgi:hypothetical protein